MIPLNWAPKEIPFPHFAPVFMTPLNWARQPAPKSGSSGQPGFWCWLPGSIEGGDKYRCKKGGFSEMQYYPKLGGEGGVPARERYFLLNGTVKFFGTRNMNEAQHTRTFAKIKPRATGDDSLRILGPKVPRADPP